MHKRLFFDATIAIQGIDRKGMLHELSKVISDKFGVNIRKITLSTDNGIFQGSIELRVHDREDVRIIIKSLKQINDMQNVQEIT